MKKRRKTDENRDNSETLSRISNIQIKGVPEKMMLSTKRLEENSQNWNIWVSRVKDNHCDLQSTCSGSLPRSPVPPPPPPAHSTSSLSGLIAPFSRAAVSPGRICPPLQLLHRRAHTWWALTDEKGLEPCPKRGTNTGTTCASEQCWVLAKDSFQPKPHP